MSVNWDEFKSENITWAQVGQVLEGRIADIGVFTNTKGDRTPKLTINTADGRTVKVICSTDLRGKLADLAPKVGDHIHIRYTGEKNVGQPSPMKTFEVGVSSRPAGQPAPQEQPVPASWATDNDGNPF